MPEDSIWKMKVNAAAEDASGINDSNTRQSDLPGEHFMVSVY
jgi:hypothetical protein